MVSGFFFAIAVICWDLVGFVCWVFFLRNLRNGLIPIVAVFRHSGCREGLSCRQCKCAKPWGHSEAIGPGSQALGALKEDFLSVSELLCLPDRACDNISTVSRGKTKPR